ncbi:hypothetical protein GCM10023238_15660 [Streptomyces heliomycini]
MEYYRRGNPEIGRHRQLWRGPQRQRQRHGCGLPGDAEHVAPRRSPARNGQAGQAGKPFRLRPKPQPPADSGCPSTPPGTPPPIPTEHGGDHLEDAGTRRSPAMAGDTFTSGERPRGRTEDRKAWPRCGSGFTVLGDTDTTFNGWRSAWPPCVTNGSGRRRAPALGRARRPAPPVRLRPRWSAVRSRRRLQGDVTEPRRDTFVRTGGKALHLHAGRRVRGKSRSS